MKLLIVKCFVLFIRILYAPMKLRKTQDKILYLSRQSDTKSLDFSLLEDALKKENPHIKQVFRLRFLKDESSLNISYIFSVFGDMWEIASSKIVILDTYSIPACCLKHKKGTEIVQIWHALGGIKKSGLQSIGKNQGRNEAISKALCMHRGYTRVLAPSKASAEYFKEAFGCKDECMIIFSLPRVDKLLDGIDRREEFLALNPEFKGKKIVAYLPTFRNNDLVYAEKIYDAFSYNNEYKLLISAHPLSETTKHGAYKYKGNFSSSDFVKFADVIISDYSACSFEASLFSKPLYFFVPDYDIYTAENGLNVDVKKEMPEYTFECAEELVECIERQSYNLEKLKSFSEKYIKHRSTGNAQRLAKYILSLLN